MPLLRDLTDDEKTLLAPLRGAARVGRSYGVDGVEVRANDDRPYITNFQGHATVYDTGYEMYGGPDNGGWVEFVDGGAGKKTLSEKPDVAFLANHGGLTMARTKSGTLSLQEDNVGLDTNALLDTRRSDVNNVVVGMENRDLDEMSFAFRIIQQRWLDAENKEVPWWDLSGIERHITEYSLHKGDVSVVNYGANPHTAAALRALDDQIRLRTALIDGAVDLNEVRQEVDPRSIPMHPALFEALRLARNLI